MKINPIHNGGPPAPTEATGQTSGKTFAQAQATPSGTAAGATGLPTVSRADLHGPRQAEILQESLMALLDRAGASLGSLPPAAREQCTQMLAADPFIAARLLNYLDQQAK